MIDVSAVDVMPDEQLRLELVIARDLAAPFVAFIDAAQRKLMIDPVQVPEARPGPHRHCDTVALPDGTPVRASSFSPANAATDRPDFGVYLDPAWCPPWPHVLLEWPDFGVPTDRESVRSAVSDVLHRARNGELVEIGCLGGHGRTGTFLALLAIGAGEPAPNAVAWVRNHYCHDAVETDEQVAFVKSF